MTTLEELVRAFAGDTSPPKLARLRVEYFAEDKKAKIYVNGTMVAEVDVAIAAVIETDFDPRHFRIMTSVGG